MNLLDENFPAPQTALLRAWRITVQHIRYDLGRLGMSDEDIVRWLHGLRKPTFFSLDRDFANRHLAHARYCLVWLDVPSGEVARYVRRTLRHPELNTKLKRMGKVIEVAPDGLEAKSQRTCTLSLASFKTIEVVKPAMLSLPDSFHSRRRFFTSSASGVGTLALASLLREDGLLAAAPHFAPKAKACICFYLEGAPSQIDLWDPKPKLNELHGQKLPDSLLKNVRFAFIQKDSVRLMGCPRKFAKHGQCGMELSDFLPHLATCVDDIAWVRSMHTEAFNHHPGQLMMNTGVPQFGRPSIGSWLNYGLGSESRNLPGYVVLTAGRGTSGGATSFQSGFLPTSYSGVLFRNKGEPVLNLSNPDGLSDAMQEKSIDALRDLNAQRHAVSDDPEIKSRIAAYELAFRMQAAAPELISLQGETKKTLDLYGLDRPEPGKGGRGGGKGTFHQFALNCLLARRLVERGVRFVNLYHASWDHHSNLNTELAYNSQMADQPVAALIKDLKARGLLDSTLVLWLSEFGRTPLGENRGGNPNATGRDHHPFGFTIWMAGGGVKGGTILGKTDEIGWHAVEDKVHVNDLHATVLHLFGLDHLKLTYRFQGRDFRLTDVAGKVVTKLLA